MYRTTGKRPRDLELAELRESVQYIWQWFLELQTDIATPVESASDYKQELIYQGLSGGSLKVAYREYVDSLARPAFTEVVEYDNQEPPFEIAFKGARITVHSATSNELVYTVTKGLVRN